MKIRYDQSAAHRRNIAPAAATTEGSPLVSHAGKVLLKHVAIPSQRPLRGRGDIPRKVVRFPPRTIDSRHSMCDAPTAGTTDKKSCCTCASSRYRKRTIWWTKSCSGKCSLASVCHRRRWSQLSASSTTACGLACRRTMANARRGSSSRKDFGKDVCCHFCISACFFTGVLHFIVDRFIIVRTRVLWKTCSSPGGCWGGWRNRAGGPRPKGGVGHAVHR